MVAVRGADASEAREVELAGSVQRLLLGGDGGGSSGCDKCLRFAGVLGVPRGSGVGVSPEEQREQCTWAPRIPGYR